MAVTNEDIVAWLNANPGLTDAQIASAMQQYGVGMQQLSQATGVPFQDIQSRYNAATGSNFQNTVTPAVTAPATKTITGASGVNQPVYSDADVLNWFNANPGATDAQIAAAMSRFNVGSEQVARVTGVSPMDVSNRYIAAAQTPEYTQFYNQYAGSTAAPLTPAQQTATTNTSTGTSTGAAYTAPTASPSTASMQTLSNWAAPYITDYLSKGQALAAMPYEAYTGPLSAGASQLQQQAFQGIAGLTVPSAFGQAAGAAGTAVQGYQNLGTYNPANITTGQWNQQAAQQYMNPYLMEALNPQLDEARRQAAITRNADAGRLAQAGAYGGSRQAIMESELNRNTLRNLADITGKGYFDAYNTGMQGFMQDQNRALEAQTATEGSRQFGANYGLAGLAGQLTGAQTLANIGQSQFGAQRGIAQDQLAAGEVQRGITSEGIKADYDQFKEERAWPYQQLQYQKDLMQGLPYATTLSYGGGDDPIARAIAAASGLGSLFSPTTTK